MTFDTWITCPKPKPQAHLRLFCLHYAGGGASVFRTWADDLPEEIEICPIQLPGRESRVMDPAFTQLMPLLEVLADKLYPHLNIPFAFFGHSMGALISFELTRYLRRQGSGDPRHLFVSAHGAPQLPNSYPPIYQLSEPQFLEELRRLDGTPEQVLQNADLMRMMLPTLRADFAICNTYHYEVEERLDCPISAFGGQDDERVSQDDLAAWTDQTRSVFTLRVFPGNHFFLRSHRAQLLLAISRDLATLLHGANRGDSSS